MNFIQVQDTQYGTTFVDFDKIEAVAIQVIFTPEKVQPAALEITTLEPRASRVIPASEEAIITLLTSGRQYMLPYPDLSSAHKFLRENLRMKMPFDMFE